MLLFSEEVFFLYMDTRREAQIKRQIEKLKRDLAAIGDLRPGSLSTQKTFAARPDVTAKRTRPSGTGLITSSASPARERAAQNSSAKNTSLTSKSR
jgi:hypothetical protein